MNTPKPQFTNKAYATVVLRMAGVLTLIFLFAALLGYFSVGPKFYEPFVRISYFLISAIMYLCLIVGWAVAYNKFFDFPNNQKVLLLGVGMAGAIPPLASVVAHLLVGEPTHPEFSNTLHGWLLFTLGSLIGAALQLYFLVFLLRYRRWDRGPS